MRKNDFTLLLGGQAGQGVESTGEGFCRSLTRAGLYAFGVPDYRSRVRGGHNFFKIRAKDAPFFSHTDEVNLVLAFTVEAIERHAGEISQDGGLVYDTALDIDKGIIPDQVRDFGMPFSEIVGNAGGSPVMLNTAQIAAAASLTGFDLGYILKVIEDNFGEKKGTKVAQTNLEVARAAYDYAKEHFKDSFPFRLESVEAPRRISIDGNSALAMGALAGGCRFMAGYPMTPSTSILQFMAARGEEYGVVMKHAEDEIAAICMAIGAGRAGVRAAAPTSGGGFSLMVEAIGLAGMTEVPVVVFEAQRPGPSTGLPTRTEQGDLLFVLHASQGDFPRIVLAPGTIEECFRDGWRAFNFAEKYQCPVIVLTDHFLANTVQTVEPDVLRFEDVVIDRGEWLTAEELDNMEGAYKRFAFTESGISPMAPVGHPKAIYAPSSDEHDEYGHIDEEKENRRKMMEKRMRKLRTATQDIMPPMLYGPEDAELTFVAWGSSYGPVREAMRMLEDAGIASNLLHITDIWPFPAKAVTEVLNKANRTVSVEMNYTGQMASLIRSQTGIKVDQQVLKYDGRPFSPDDIIHGLKEV